MSTEPPIDDAIRAEPPEPLLAEPGPAEPATLTADEKMWGMFCHLSVLLSFWVAGMTFIGPLICWLVKKDTSKFVDYHGKESLNFQLNILIYTIVAAVISVPLGIVTCGVGFVIVFVPLIYGIVMPIVAGLKANEGSLYEYPYTFRLIK